MPAQQSRPPDADARRKTTLFCPSCGHESDVDGDWNLRSGQYVCPVCSAPITGAAECRPPAGG